jgi:hypothetical protein
LDAALALGIEHGGWCPQGRLAEDGVIPRQYRLRQTSSAEYPVRTERNVVDSDATLILYRQRVSGGTRLTRHLARQHGKPLVLVNLQHGGDEQAVRDWIAAHGVRVLNVAGPRESSAPGIGQEACDFLQRVLANGPPTDLKK